MLLDGKREMKIGEGSTQMYRTGGDTTYVFMPVARQADMVCFYLLRLLAKESQSEGLKAFVRLMKSRLTRIRLAFEGEAGCKFLDFAPQGDALPKFRYGFGKIMKGTATDGEVARRKADAMMYKKVLLGNNRNEIVLAYRQHGTLSKPSSFPIFAKAVFMPKEKKNEWACANCGFHKGFVVVKDNGELTTEIITLKGEKRLWRTDDFGERARVTCPGGACPCL